MIKLSMHHSEIKLVLMMEFMKAGLLEPFNSHLASKPSPRTKKSTPPTNNSEIREITDIVYLFRITYLHVGF